MDWHFQVQARAKRVPAAIRGLLILPACGLPIYGWFTYTGPYRWMAEWQMRTWGSYQVVLTGLLLLLPPLLLALVLIHFLAGFFPDADQESAEDFGERQIELEQKIRANTFWLAGLLLGLGLLVTSGYFLVASNFYGVLTDLSIDRLERGGSPPSRYVRLRGRLDRRRQIRVQSKQSGSTLTWLYIPVVSDRWTPGRDVKVYLKLHRRWLVLKAHQLRSGVHRGTLSRNALPGVARTVISRRLGREPRNYWVLDYQNSPARTREMAYGLGGVGMVLSLVVGFFWWRKRRPGSG